MDQGVGWPHQEDSWLEAIITTRWTTRGHLIPIDLKLTNLYPRILRDKSGKRANTNSPSSNVQVIHTCVPIFLPAEPLTLSTPWVTTLRRPADV